MKTDIEAKFILIEILGLSLVELPFIENLTIPKNIIDDLYNDKVETLKVYFENIKNDDSISDDTRLIAACLRTKIKDNSVRLDFLDLAEDDEFADEEGYNYYDEDLSEEEKNAIKENEKESNKLWRDRETEFHKALPILKKYTQEQMNEIMFNYVWQQYPKLQKGFDRNIYSKARDGFFSHIGISYYRYQLPQKVLDKINIAEDYVKDEVVNRFKKMEIENIDNWIIEYKRSMNELGIKKYTKGSIKAFFKELGFKVSSIVIDTMKSKL